MHLCIFIPLKQGAVSSFRVRASTIIAVLIWEIFKNRTGGYPIIDFTAEMRKVPDYYYNNTEEDLKWEKLEPHHITPNARYLEVFHLLPNTSYQFRIWANNELGAGDMYTVTSRTIAPTQEKGMCVCVFVCCMINLTRFHFLYDFNKNFRFNFTYHGGCQGL